MIGAVPTVAQTVTASASQTVSATAGTTVEVASMRDVPLYDGDQEEANGIPPAVERLKAQLIAADGLLLVSPERMRR